MKALMHRFLPVLVASLLTSPASADSLEKILTADWQGAWILLLTEASSNCDDSYTDNPVEGGRPQLRGQYRFARGELARVHRIQVKRSRIDFLLDVAEPLRISFSDGPYELYQQRSCKIELEVTVPRQLVKQQSVEEIEAFVADVVGRYPDRRAAEAAPEYNGRRVEPYPEGYEQTLAAHREWKAEELRRQLQERLAETLQEASRIVERIQEDPAYEDGFTSGLRAYRASSRSTECQKLPDASFYPSGGRPPSELPSAEQKEWKRGYRDGQRLAHGVDLAERLEICLR